MNSALATVTSAINGFRYIDSVSTGTDGGTSMTMSTPLETEHMYLVLVRNLKGLEDLYAPYAYLIWMRSKNWGKTTIGTPVDVSGISIGSSKLTISFSSKQFARMWIYCLTK